MFESTLDPNVMKGLIAFGVVLFAAMLGRWVLNVRGDMQHRQKEKAAKKPT